MNVMMVHPLRELLLLCVALLLVFLSSSGCGNGKDGPSPVKPPLEGQYPEGLPRPGFDTASLKVGNSMLKVELADTPERRAYGMMFVTELPEERGMLFLYPERQQLGFWMRNTLIPLDIAFIAEMGEEFRIVNIHRDMEPYREKPNYASSGACRLALEVPGGWLERHQIGVGDRIEISPEVLQREVIPDGAFRNNLPRLLGD